MANWNERRVLIAGGSAGFGKALALASLARGAETFVSARDSRKLDEFAAEAKARYPGALLHVRSVDVLDPASLDDWFAEVRRSTDGLDVVACIVGRSSRGRVLDQTPESLVDSFRTNVVSALLVAQRSGELLAQRKGTLVTIGSLASKVATPYLGAYPSAKFALAGLTQQLRFELEPLGVRTLFVMPGPMAREDAGTRYDAQSADLPEAARLPGGGVPVDALSPQELAERVFRAIERGDFELTVPRKVAWLAAIWQIAPKWAKSILDRQLKRARR